MLLFKLVKTDRLGRHDCSRLGFGSGLGLGVGLGWWVLGIIFLGFGGTGLV